MLTATTRPEVLPNHYYWSTDAVSTADRVNRWRDALAKACFECDVETGPQESFWASIALDRYGTVGVGRYAGSKRRLDRSTDQAKRGAETFIFSMVSSGQYIFEQNGREVTLSPGDGFLLHCCLPGKITALEGAEKRSIGIPGDMLGRALGDSSCPIGRFVRHEQPESRLLAAYLQAIQQTAGLSEPATRNVIGQQIVDLVVAAIGRNQLHAAESAERGVRAARLRLARDMIRKSVGDPMLNGERVARKLGISERYVQRLFEENGSTVSAFIMEERLNAARRQFADPAQDGRRIAEIAFSAGFSDITHFNRAFKRRYGETPSSFRAH
jgi:AraC-like DNA-binding protein